MEKRKKRNGRGVRWIAALLLSALLAGALSASTTLQRNCICHQ